MAEEQKIEEETTQPDLVLVDTDMVQTVVDIPGAAEAAAHKEAEAPAKEGGTEEKGGEAAPAKEADREGFIPRDRFDEVNTVAKKVPELEIQLANLKGQIDVLSKQPAAEGAPAADPDFIDGLGDLGSEELMDSFEKDPKAFLESYADSLSKRILSTQSNQTDAKDFEGKVVKTIEAFAEKNPEFNGLWDSGKITQFMDDNPGYDATGAYYALTEGSRGEAVTKQIEDAVTKATKETEAKFQKFLKKDNASLPGGPAATATIGAPVELQDTKKSGGLVHSLAARVIAGRQG